MNRKRSIRSVVRALVCLALSQPMALQAQTASATYTYDAAGRIAAILFSDGTCVAHTYDSNGNRTGTVITNAGAPGTSAWGSGVWGCFPWQP
jgi:hypothetical protein